MDANGHAKFNASRREAWDDKLHKIEEAITNELRLSKYRCPCFYCCATRRPILIPIIRAHFLKIWM
jgi:hypothetical protein